MKLQRYLIYIGAFLLLNCNNGKITFSNVQGKQHVIDKNIKYDKQILTLINPYKKVLDKELNNTICYTNKTLSRLDGELESSLGNLLADICFEKVNLIFSNKTQKNIDFVLLNYGGIRAQVPKGNISLKNAYEIMPFENKLVVVKLSGIKVKDLLTYLYVSKKAHPISKLSLKINNETYQDVLINNIPFDESRSYYVLTSDYLQEGGDDMSFFNKPISLQKTNYKIRNVLIDYFTKTDTVKTSLDQRFSYAK